MDTKHTPGPWYEAGTGNHQGLVISESTSANVAVAYDKKDACLIAAAPDLLAALDCITRCLSINGPAGTTAYIIADENMERARAAIAKARGEE